MYSFASVTLLNAYAAQLLSCDERLSSLEVTGELSGFKVYSSGPAYFTLKDKDSEVPSQVLPLFIRTRADFRLFAIQ